jgi:hypothetical protein
MPYCRHVDARKVRNKDEYRCLACKNILSQTETIAFLAERKRQRYLNRDYMDGVSYQTFGMSFADYMYRCVEKDES